MKHCILFIVILIFTSSCKKEKNRICDVYESEHGYSVGTIQKYTSVPTKVNYHYDYYVNGTLYSAKEKAYGIGQENKKWLGMSFLVVYRIDDPTDSDLNTDYVIEEVADFNALVDEFEQTPPEPDWPKCK